MSVPFDDGRNHMPDVVWKGEPEPKLSRSLAFCEEVANPDYDTKTG